MGSLNLINIRIIAVAKTQFFISDAEIMDYETIIKASSLPGLWYENNDELFEK